MSTKGILLIFSSVEFLLERASLWDRCFIFSRSSLGLCLESWLGQNRCVKGVEAGCMGGSLCSGGDVIKDSFTCLYMLCLQLFILKILHVVEPVKSLTLVHCSSNRINR